MLYIERNDAYRQMDFYRRSLFHVVSRFSRCLPTRICDEFLHTQEKLCNRLFEKENVELLTQEELEGDELKKEEFEEVEPARLKLKAKLETYGLESGEFGEEGEEEDEDEDSETKRETESSIADSVKS